MKKIPALLILTLLLAHAMALTAFAERDELFQVSTIEALLAGVYDGEVDFATLGRHADFALGTVNGLNGEMVGVDGKFYRVDVDGSVHPIPDTAKTPFAAGTEFAPDFSFTIPGPVTFEGLKTTVDAALPTKNVFFAVRISGRFASLTVRSVPGQQKPYPPLAEVVKEQRVFTFKDVRGDLVGFRCPQSVGGLNVPGWHFHFLSDDKTRGGHVLALQGADLETHVDTLTAFSLVLPTGGAFFSPRSGVDRDELSAVEKE